MFTMAVDSQVTSTCMAINAESIGCTAVDEVTQWPECCGDNEIAFEQVKIVYKCFPKCISKSAYMCQGKDDARILAARRPLDQRHRWSRMMKTATADRRLRARRRVRRRRLQSAELACEAAELSSVR